MSTRRPPPSLKARAIAWLSMREHSRAELERKLHALLQRREAEAQAQAQAEGEAEAPNRTRTPAGAAATDQPAPTQAVPVLLDWLEAKGYLSDRRYAETRVRSRSSRYGVERLRRELAVQGVPLDADLRTTLTDTELPRAAALIRRRYGDEAPADANDRARRLRFLMARGFSADTARRALGADADRSGSGDAPDDTDSD